jgi:hypothetical protein
MLSVAGMAVEHRSHFVITPQVFLSSGKSQAEARDWRIEMTLVLESTTGRLRLVIIPMILLR